MGTVKSEQKKEQKKEGKEEHMKIKETPEQTAKQLVMEQEVNMQAEIKRKTAKEEYTNMQKEEIQQGFKMLEYFDELAKEGKFENYIEKSKKKPGEAKEEELDIAPMLSHPIGMAGWPDHDSTKLYPQEAHYLDQTYNKDGSPVKLLNPDHNVLTTLKETYQILMFYKGVGDEKSMKKAHMLAYLIHMVGDMHQPLHMITRCKSNGDICDNGGSEFFISGLTTTFRKADCLHELWDQAMLKFPNSRSVKEFAKEYTNAAKDLIKKLDKTMSEQQLAIDNLIPVSYTHLTLPTICSV
eukprot:TRINITY_DN8558_c0_g5_i2.p1 TRINITY_DN8558_c0_g5~~TRINITY_DN8558_c0_g5_i2.p1  ORF type:complete len:296 (+),score=43.84 TRINITY_DN8558_c0_g5_i2:384-1271(+)